MMTKEGCFKIIDIIILGAGVLVLWCGHMSHIVTLNYFFKNLLYSGAKFKQTKCIVIKI